MQTALDHPEFQAISRPEIAYGRGVWLEDVTGRRYLDACSGAIVANIGHGVVDVNNAITRQLEQVAFVYRTQFSSASARQVCERLAALAPGDLNWVSLTVSGSAANEAAIRLAVQFWRSRDRPRKHKVVGRRTSYHGMSVGALSVSGHPERRNGLESLLIDLPHAPSTYRCPPSNGEVWAKTVERTIIEADPATVAAVIVEPVVGAAAGALPSPPGYLRALREVCDRYEVLLIADEIMTGLGRTGHWFASTRDGVIPDVITVGKGMSAGYAPIAALIARESIAANGVGNQIFGHTYDANPVGAAATLAVLDFIERHDLLTHVARTGQVLREGLLQLAVRHSSIEEVRGEGLLLGVQLRPDLLVAPGGGDTSHRLVDLAFERGLLVYPAGTDECPAAVLIAPPFVITSQEVAELLKRLGEAFGDFEQANRKN